MTACVIMHNMIIDDERDDSIFDQGFDFQGDDVEPLHQEPAMFAQFTQFHREMHDWHTHLDLQNDLIEHMWNHIGILTCRSKIVFDIARRVPPPVTSKYLT